MGLSDRDYYHAKRSEIEVDADFLERKSAINRRNAIKRDAKPPLGNIFGGPPPAANAGPSVSPVSGPSEVNWWKVFVIVEVLAVVAYVVAKKIHLIA